MKKGLSASFMVVLMLVIVLSSGFSVYAISINNESKQNELPLIPQTFGKTIYVDDDNTGGPWDGTFEHPYQYIQDGIDNAISGDTVYAFNGTYFENVKITKRSIKLMGEDKNTTIIGGSDSGSVIFLELKSDYTHVCGFTIQNSSNSGIYCFSNHNKFYDNIITNCDKGIFLEEPHEFYFNMATSYNQIYRNIIYDNNGVGIRIEGSSGFPFIYVQGCHNKIYENIISNNRYMGIFMGVGSQGASFNSIYKNYINNHTRNIDVHGDCNSITYNDIRNGKKYGVEISHSFGTNVKRNNFIDNDKNAYFYNSYFTGWDSNYWHDWSGARNYEIKGLKVTFKGYDEWGWPIYEEKVVYDYDYSPAEEPYDITEIVSIPRNKATNNMLLLRFLEQFPLLNRFLNLLTN